MLCSRNDEVVTPLVSYWAILGITCKLFSSYSYIALLLGVALNFYIIRLFTS